MITKLQLPNPTALGCFIKTAMDCASSSEHYVLGKEIILYYKFATSNGVNIYYTISWSMCHRELLGILRWYNPYKTTCIRKTELNATYWETIAILI